MMRKKSITLSLLYVLLSILCWSKNVHSSFWKDSPHKFSTKLTTEMLMVYSGIDVDECKDQIKRTPNKFFKNYGFQVEAITEIINENFDLIYQELHARMQTAGDASEEKTLREYVKWLRRTMKQLQKIRNYTGVAIIALALAVPLNYDIATGKVNGKLVGIDTNEMENLLANFTQRAHSQKFERKRQRSGTYFFPNIITLRRELELLTGGDITYSLADQAKLTKNICEKLSHDFLLSYKQHFVNSATK